MGLARQSVQRLADCLVADELATYQPNPHHRRAKLLAPSARGWLAIEILLPRQWAWANSVASAVGCEQLQAANAVLDTLLSELSVSPTDHPNEALQAR